MKRVLITGKSSYIGNRLAEWLSQWPDQYQVDKVSLKESTWQEQSWSAYDCVVHVAGIAHNSSDPKLEDLYYQVNRDLTVKAAEKAKTDGVSQFVYLSSMIVFGSKKSRIDSHTQPDPDNFYGDSKLQGELGILPLQDKHFQVAIVRPPMVYGPGSKGNFPKLVKLARLTPIFPDYDNKRSMIYVENLMAELQAIIDQNLSGYFHPQNQDYVKTSEMVRQIAEVSGHKIYLTKVFNPLIHLMKNQEIVKKMFGDLYYTNSTFSFENDFVLFKESIKKSIQ
ncbi:NAD-dependent epimerase/dehydratase family protein [Hutsoniella sourekii]